MESMNAKSQENGVNLRNRRHDDFKGQVLNDEDAEAEVKGYRLYYPLVSEWEHPDGVRFDQPRD